jgi:methylenetetrahydrofolate reductase (NADPH)
LPRRKHHSLCGATIVEKVRQGIAALSKDDKDALVAWGIEFAVRMCRELLEAGVSGLHIYTMDRSKSAAGIVNRLRSEGLL